MSTNVQNEELLTIPRPECKILYDFTKKKRKGDNNEKKNLLHAFAACPDFFSRL